MMQAMNAKSIGSFENYLILRDEFSGFLEFLRARRSDPWKKTNKVLHFDFVMLQGMDAKSIGSFENYLILRDEYSGILEFFFASEDDRCAIADALVVWILRGERHFVMAYSPWLNGSVEIVYQHLQCAMKILGSDFRMQPEDWPLLDPAIQSTLNHTKSVHRDALSQSTRITGPEPPSPLNGCIGSSQRFESLKLLKLQKIRTLRERSGFHWKDFVKISGNRFLSQESTSKEKGVLAAPAQQKMPKVMPRLSVLDRITRTIND